MAKVVGKDETYVHRVSCDKCASRVEYTLNEVTKIDGTDYSGGPNGYTYIICPNPKCQQRIILDRW